MTCVTFLACNIILFMVREINETNFLRDLPPVQNGRQHRLESIVAASFPKQVMEYVELVEMVTVAEALYNRPK